VGRHWAAAVRVGLACGGDDKASGADHDMMWQCWFRRDVASGENMYVYTNSAASGVTRGLFSHPVAPVVVCSNVTVDATSNGSVSSTDASSC
jgi:hypothetical protein